MNWYRCGILDRLLPHRRTAGQLVRFCVVGFTNTLIDFGIYTGLTRLVPFFTVFYVVANVIAYTLATFSSYAFNTFWTFRCDFRGWHRKMTKFFIVALTGMVWNTATLYGLTELGLHDLLSKVVATAVSLAWNFTLQKKWTFRA